MISRRKTTQIGSAALTLALLAPAAVGAQPGPSGFTDVTEEAGLVYVQHVPPAPPDCVVSSGSCEIDRMTGGAAVGDVDRDGWPDLFVTRLDAPDLLFRNRGDGTFEEISGPAGLAAFDLQSNGAGFLDADNDGDLDLLVTSIALPGDPVNHRNHLFVNDGTGVFTEEAVARGIDDSSPGTRVGWSVSFGDFDRDGWVDVHTTEWVGFGRARLFRNLGDAAPGHFEDVTESLGVDTTGVWSFASTFADLDGDGWQELAVAADFGTSRLFWNQGGTSFLDGTEAAGVGTDENGMGSTFGDVDGDGDLDWFVTSIWDPDDTCSIVNCNWGGTGNRLYRNEGGRLFSDATDDAGVREGDWGWGTVFFDMDNDADQDLVMTNGVVFEGTAIDDVFNFDPMRLWRNEGGGVMSEVSTELGVTDTGSGKGLLTFDYDADGDLDIFVVNNAGEPRLYRNDLVSANRWIRIRVRGSASNREALGAKVSVWRTPWDAPQVREVGVASHYLGQSEATLHFGLGPGWRRVHRVRVEFPASGRVQERLFLRADQTHVIRERRHPACGLLGAEALLVLAPLILRKRRLTRSHRP